MSLGSHSSAQEKTIDIYPPRKTSSTKVKYRILRTKQTSGVLTKLEVFLDANYLQYLSISENDVKEQAVHFINSVGSHSSIYTGFVNCITKQTEQYLKEQFELFENFDDFKVTITCSIAHIQEVIGIKANDDGSWEKAGKIISCPETVCYLQISAESGYSKVCSKIGGYQPYPDYPNKAIL